MRDALPSIPLPPFPRFRWIALFFILWLSFGLVPTMLVYIGENYFAVADAVSAAIAGTIGDAFGLANAFFSGAALLFVIWSIRLQQQEIQFARAEWQENTASQREQALIMKQAASLTAINHIYSHYSRGYSENDETGVLASVAAGHRRWAIRESFSSVDSLFASERESQVNLEERRLAELLKVPQAAKEYMNEVAMLTASVLVDARASERFRRTLWPIYELLRSAPTELCIRKSPAYEQFLLCAKRASSTGLLGDG